MDPLYPETRCLYIAWGKIFFANKIIDLHGRLVIWDVSSCEKIRGPPGAPLQVIDFEYFFTTDQELLVAFISGLMFPLKERSRRSPVRIQELPLGALSEYHLLIVTR